jgi:hypothetical protein
MRSRYVVEVVEETSPEPLTPPPAQPAPSQPVVALPPSGSDEPVVFVPSVVGSAVQASEPADAPSPSVMQTPSPVPLVSQGVSIHDRQAALREKLNQPVDIPQVIAQNALGTSSHRQQPESPPDLFDRLQPAVQHAWQQEQLQSAREVPQVVLPRAPKSRRVEPLPVRPQPVPSERLERIERMFTPTPGGYNGKSGGGRSFSNNASRFSQKPVSRRSRRVFLSTAILLMFILGSAAATAALIQRDISHARVLASTIQRNLSEGNMAQAKENVTILERKQQRYRGLYTVVRPSLDIVLGKEKAKHLDALWEVSDRGLKVADQSFLTYDTATLAYAQFVGKQSGSAVDTTASLSGQLEILYSNLSSLQAEVAGLDNPFEWDFIETAQTEAEKKLPVTRRSILASQQLVPVLPELLGSSGRKQYLLLLQNNAELRPTGGFIGSLGILTVENGRFVDFRVEDVYEADGQLNGYVEPPAELKKYLGEAQWYLRDVNWSPDFPTVAEQAGWFLDKTLDIKPDGVIAINLSVVQGLLQSTGPITLVDYNEVITADNLYERAQMHAEVNFFPGSSQKRDFLSAVSTALFQKLMQGGESSATVLPALYHSAQESQILVSVKDPAVSTVFQSLGWEGGVLTPDCPPPFSQGSCVVDTVMQVEANVGVNKANQFVNRDIHHSVAIEAAQAVHTRRVTLENTSQSNAWPQGAYKSYFRLFVSPRASLTSVTIDGVNVATEEVTQQQEVGKQSFGFLVNVPVRSTSVVEVQYSVPLDSGWSAYALFEQKQSGTGARPGSDVLTHDISVNESRVVTIAPEPDTDLTQSSVASAGGGAQRYVFESDRSTHEFMAIEVLR